MRRALVISAFAILAGGPAAAADVWATSPRHAGQPQSPAWCATLQEWLTAVEGHHPGQADVPAAVVGVFTWHELNGTLTHLLGTARALSGALAAQARQRRDGRTVTYAGHEFPAAVLQSLLGLTDDEARRGDVNRILRRGALLHADIAILLPPERQSHFDSREPNRVRQSHEAVDGRITDLGTEVVHWEFGRVLLDAVTPSPAADDTVRTWYQATASWLLGKYALSAAAPHLSRARALFPRDARILFLSGALEEILAAPLVQTVVSTTTLPIGTRFTVGSEQAHLREAERFFRGAIEQAREFAEARVHHGRVLGRLGRHEDAARELRTAIETGFDAPLSRYYAQLFLGAEEQALGRDEAAAAAYRQAAALYPDAQSPHLAIAQLARGKGNRAAALEAMRRVLALPAEERLRVDPWWLYLVWCSSETTALLQDMRRPFLRAEP